MMFVILKEKQQKILYQMLRMNYKKHVKNTRAQLNYKLIEEHEPLLISANMALMSKLPISKITQDKDLEFYYNKALNNFEIRCNPNV